MHTVIAIYLVMMVSVILPGTLSAEPAAEKTVRTSPLAGAWYPADKGSLEKMLSSYLAEADPPSFHQRAVALISPHAGYVYSGKAAAHGFKAVKNKNYQRVIIIGPSHYARFHGLVVSTYGYYETPLGKVPVDTTSCGKLSFPFSRWCLTPSPLFRSW